MVSPKIPLIAGENNAYHRGDANDPSFAAPFTGGHADLTYAPSRTYNIVEASNALALDALQVRASYCKDNAVAAGSKRAQGFSEHVCLNLDLFSNVALDPVQLAIEPSKRERPDWAFKPNGVFSARVTKEDILPKGEARFVAHSAGEYLQYIFGAALKKYREALTEKTVGLQKFGQSAEALAQQLAALPLSSISTPANTTVATNQSNFIKSLLNGLDLEPGDDDGQNLGRLQHRVDELMQSRQAWQSICAQLGKPADYRMDVTELSDVLKNLQAGLTDAAKALDALSADAWDDKQKTAFVVANQQIKLNAEKLMTIVNVMDVLQQQHHDEAMARTVVSFTALAMNETGLATAEEDIARISVARQFEGGTRFTGSLVIVDPLASKPGSRFADRATTQAYDESPDGAALRAEISMPFLNPVQRSNSLIVKGMLEAPLVEKYAAAVDPIIGGGLDWRKTFEGISLPNELDIVANAYLAFPLYDSGDWDAAINNDAGLEFGWQVRSSQQVWLTPHLQLSVAEGFAGVHAATPNTRRKDFSGQVHADGKTLNYEGTETGETYTEVGGLTARFSGKVLYRFGPWSDTTGNAAGTLSLFVGDTYTAFKQGVNINTVGGGVQGTFDSLVR